MQSDRPHVMDRPQSQEYSYTPRKFPSDLFLGATQGYYTPIRQTAAISKRLDKTQTCGMSL